MGVVTGVGPLPTDCIRTTASAGDVALLETLERCFAYREAPVNKRGRLKASFVLFGQEQDPA